MLEEDIIVLLFSIYENRPENRKGKIKRKNLEVDGRFRNSKISSSDQRKDSEL